MSQKHKRDKQIITINVGGCGYAWGLASLEQYCVEQGISPDATKDEDSKTPYDDNMNIMFKETASGTYKARSLFFDLDPVTINIAQNIYKYSKVLNKSYMKNGKEGSHNIWANGHYVVGKELISTATDRIRLAVEECDAIQGFIINHSIAGGTGGGLGALILERICVDYRRKCKFAFQGFHDENQLTVSIQPYNSLLSMHWSLDHTEISMMLDNQQLYRQCQRKLGIKTPRFKHFNNICVKLMSSITAPFRMGLSNDDLQAYPRDLVPYPRLHFLNSGMSPILPNKEKTVKYKDDIRILTDECLKADNFMISCMDFDCEEDKNMALQFNYRGNGIKEYLKECNDTMRWLRNNRKYSMVEWSSTDEAGMKFVGDECGKLKDDVMMIGDKQVTMVANNSCISRMFANRISKKYDMLYSQRSYVHWYVGYGMEEGEFAEAREDMGFLEKDYLDILSEPPPFSEDDDY